MVGGDGRKRVGGVAVVNGSSGAAVFRDVEISAASWGGTAGITIEVLPPGRFLVLSKGRGKGFQPIPQPLTDEESARWQPVTRSTKHAITRMTFCDPLGSPWTWDESAGLRADGR